MIRLPLARLLLLAVAVVALGACSSNKKKEKFAYVERPVEVIYEQAATAMERKRYDEAVELFAEVERQHPYSAWARRAILMKAFAHYRQNDYDEAIETLDQFIALHPGNKDAPYAYYLRAMSYYERIRDVGRDQDYTNNAVQALNDLVGRYPESEYARDARLKLDLTFDHLAGKEMYVGRYYLKSKKHIAAINRFKMVVENYETTSHAAEALYRLVEANLQIGLVEEARAAAAVLGYNYPGSVWYEDAYRLMRRATTYLSPAPGQNDRAREESDEDNEEEAARGEPLTEPPRPSILEPPSDDPFEESLENPIEEPDDEPI